MEVPARVKTFAIVLGLMLSSFVYVDARVAAIQKPTDYCRSLIDNEISWSEDPSLIACETSNSWKELNLNESNFQRIKPLLQVSEFLRMDQDKKLKNQNVSSDVFFPYSRSSFLFLTNVTDWQRVEFKNCTLDYALEKLKSNYKCRIGIVDYSTLGIFNDACVLFHINNNSNQEKIWNFEEHDIIIFHKDYIVEDLQSLLDKGQKTFIFMNNDYKLIFASKNRLDFVSKVYSYASLGDEKLRTVFHCDGVEVNLNEISKCPFTLKIQSGCDYYRENWDELDLDGNETWTWMKDNCDIPPRFFIYTVLHGFRPSEEVSPKYSIFREIFKNSKESVAIFDKDFFWEQKTKSKSFFNVYPDFWSFLWEDGHFVWAFQVKNWSTVTLQDCNVTYAQEKVDSVFENQSEVTLSKKDAETLNDSCVTFYLNDGNYDGFKILEESQKVTVIPDFDAIKSIERLRKMNDANHFFLFGNNLHFTSRLKAFYMVLKRAKIDRYNFLGTNGEDILNKTTEIKINN